MTTTYTYDGLGRLTQESSSEGKVYNYTYDASSNRASMVISNNGTTIESVVYTYDANNRLLREVNTLLLSVKTTEYAYDNNGNLLSNYVYSSSDTVISSLVYTYNGFNQQASVSANDGTITAHYTYNAQGIRDAKTLGITTTEFLLDGGAVVGEMRGLSTDTYLRGSNLISANGDTYYLFNGHGDVVNLTNTSGSSTKAYEYDVFGVEDDIDSNDLNPFRYCGEYFDNETGTYYLRARYYDPKRGRFTQEDTLALNVFTYTPQILLIAQVGNKYIYCANNPVMYSDPSGNKVDVSPDPRQIAIDDGGTAPGDSSGGTGSTGGTGNAGDAGDTGGQKPNLPDLPDSEGSGQTDTSVGNDSPTPDAFDYDESGGEQENTAKNNEAGSPIAEETVEGNAEQPSIAPSLEELAENVKEYTSNITVESTEYSGWGAFWEVVKMAVKLGLDVTAVIIEIKVMIALSATGIGVAISASAGAAILLQSLADTGVDFTNLVLALTFLMNYGGFTIYEAKASGGFCGNKSIFTYIGPPLGV